MAFIIMSTPTKRIAFHTLGCKLNYSETSTISRDLIHNGFEKVDYQDTADIYVINTCSVTDNADKEARKLIRQAKRSNPSANIAVIGCYAQLNPDEIADIDGVDIVIGAEEKFNLLEHLNELSVKEEKMILGSDIDNVHLFEPSYSIGDRTRSYLKIQDGCDYTCSFCTIPLARGKSRSGTINATIALAKEVALAGAKEIVLTGVNIGDFGAGSDETLLDLLIELDEIEGVQRFRISSIEPNLLNNDIITFCNMSKKFVPHFHIPLQSGSNKILKAMRRRYDRDLYVDRINSIKSLNSDTCIGVDVMVGFPGESDEDFLETYNFLNDLDISYLHVFTYSERQNTYAIQINETIPKPVKAERSKTLHALSNKKRRLFYDQFISTKRDVLFENVRNGKLLVIPIII
ncbi:tRNA (N(6)-L-threonylcarbamoyladenosine(37)-C(2))-methylthiotransferase MtaB [bacterium]|nr:MAG: tRNA (N(6)-L-threonylcarbamoyladenosine(37)-C(2))-methylthiotransferase MtaB [bacterium]